MNQVIDPAISVCNVLHATPTTLCVSYVYFVTAHCVIWETQLRLDISQGIDAQVAQRESGSCRAKQAGGLPSDFARGTGDNNHFG
jgi:hypothetical protein